MPEYAYMSTKNPNNKLLIDDVIQVKINQPKIRLSRKKKNILLTYGIQTLEKN